MIKAYGGNCGIWFSNGIYYIDKSHRVPYKKGSLLKLEENVTKDINTQNGLIWV